MPMDVTGSLRRQHGKNANNESAEEGNIRFLTASSISVEWVGTNFEGGPPDLDLE